MYAINTTFAMSAARPPAYVALPGQSQQPLWTHVQVLTLKDEVDGKEVGANGQSDHGKSETHQFPNNGPVGMSQCNVHSIQDNSRWHRR